MIQKYINNLQERSHTEKSNFALISSLVLTGIIASLWFVTIFMNPEDYFKSGDSEAQNLANAGSLFDVFKASLK
jgi:hypothetical protein